MNGGHARLCTSRRWAEFIAGRVVPTVLGGRDVGEELLEIGPGYGAATAQLASPGRTLTAVEVDPALVARLRKRLPAVDIHVGRGEELSFPDGRFSGVVCFTMLHHVHTRADQDALFAEACRVLRRGGVFAGSDSIASNGLRSFHRNDTYTPVDPAGLTVRLRAAGFDDVEIAVAPEDEWFSFAARRP